MTISYHSLPEHMRDGMRLYIEHGVQPGSFLRAVLSNDLMGALGRADDVNINALPAYGRFLYNEAPSLCWGSPDVVSAWIVRGGMSAPSAA